MFFSQNTILLSFSHRFVFCLTYNIVLMRYLVLKSYCSQNIRFCLQLVIFKFLEVKNSLSGRKLSVSHRFSYDYQNNSSVLTSCGLVLMDDLYVFPVFIMFYFTKVTTLFRLSVCISFYGQMNSCTLLISCFPTMMTSSSWASSMRHPPAPHCTKQWKLTAFCDCLSHIKHKTRLKLPLITSEHFIKHDFCALAD